MQWNDPRPLGTGPGRALAAMMTDSPGRAYALAAGALERAARVEVPDPDAPGDALEAAVADYLSGVAAAAIVADAATGRRAWTGPHAFAVNGGQVAAFLPPEGVLLGTLALAMAAVNRAVELLPLWEAHPGVAVPAEFGPVVGRVQRALATAAQGRMTQVADRAEEVNG